MSFADCSLIDSEFSELDWKHLSFDNCRLTNSNWYHTPLHKLDLSTCDFEQIHFSQENIRGLILNQEQAILIALALGIVISDL